MAKFQAHGPLVSSPMRSTTSRFARALGVQRAKTTCSEPLFDVGQRRARLALDRSIGDAKGL